MTPAKEVLDALDCIPNDHVPPTRAPMASTAASGASNDKPSDSDKTPEKEEKKRRIPPIVFVPLLGAFLVITIVPSVVSNVINKTPAPTPAPASNGGTTTGFGEGMATPTPAPNSVPATTTTRTPMTTSPTPSGPPEFSISTVLQSRVWDIGYHAPSRTFLGINDSLVWALPTIATTAAAAFFGGAGGGRRLDADAAGNLYVLNVGARGRVNHYSAASNYATATQLATALSNVDLTSVLAMPSSTGMDVAAATQPGAVLGWNTSALTTAGVEIVAANVTDPFLANDMVYRNGVIYMADGPSSCIRRLTLSTGVTEVVAGQCFYSGHADGDATTSTWNSPFGIAMDYYGDLYISDTMNHVIRKIDMATKIVTTIAGKVRAPGLVNSATNASLGQLNAPQGLAIDPTLQWKATAGSFALYVADTGNNCVRKITWG
ncbi:hypothetical protein H310_11602 [Aphanomyces invadans]|uniref:SMP-30/Gluconolactonase/LRE-like region domain-containing protein n=1 Tax=Aphanomyces invadans TaxID=157072 RepID=A0A024TLV9_9STRA|nr:hypothetical protein H310_11602 [Aphanomyces invadans]ETV94959.1 hypothetical protein H310_11602 [Aphanomyces invadans]|eukprot:XP_008876550.1 hypothetical protein H310_11602 [Aphanomyces invadans]